MLKIPLTKDKEALVDQKDYNRVMLHSWQAAKYRWSDKHYARTDIFVPGGKGLKKVVKMHRFILGVVDNPEIQVDHLNGNPLDNTRSNIRLVTPSQNMQNRPLLSHNKSGYIGVYWRSARSKWVARIQKNGKRRVLGHFDCKIEAAESYNKAALELYGQDAQLNIIGGREC